MSPAIGPPKNIYFYAQDV